MAVIQIRWFSSSKSDGGDRQLSDGGDRQLSSVVGPKALPDGQHFTTSG